METLGTLRSFAPAHHNSRAAGLGRITDCFPAISRRWCHLPSTQAHLRGLELVVRVVVAQQSVDPPEHYPLVSKSTAHPYRHLRCYCVAPMPPCTPWLQLRPTGFLANRPPASGAGRAKWPQSQRPEPVAPEESRLSRRPHRYAHGRTATPWQAPRPWLSGSPPGFISEVA